MSVTPISTVCLIGDTNEKKNVNTKKILTEEEYTEKAVGFFHDSNYQQLGAFSQSLGTSNYPESTKLDKIITRDFFPDVPKLKAQNEYLSALEKGDIAKIQEIQLAYQPSQSSRSRVNSVRTVASTPSGFETPDVSTAGSPLRSEKGSRADSIASEKKPVSLDQFLAQSTSEDNASFQIIMEKSALVHQQKYPWLYKDENEEQNKLTKMLALPSTESDTVTEEKPELVTWAYKNQNSLMYVPPGADFTTEEKLNYGNRKEISHGNTRFEAPPFDEEANKEAIAEAASVQAKMKEGKVGIDGKEIIPGDSPQVNGYGFVGTPVPDPGITDTPIMTWGEIEGTPFRLDGSDTPLPQNPGGQQFKIPNLSARERIALSLADKVAKKHRKKPNTNLLSPMHISSYSPATPMEKLQNMSPAARKLACAKLGIQQNTDKALRASYSPSPSPLRTPNANKTPVLLRSPVVSPAIKTLIKPSDADTMMSLPKRHKASDFF